MNNVLIIILIIFKIRFVIISFLELDVEQLA